MNLNNNTILITGGGTGIGLGLALAFHAQGNKVIITGRRKEVLRKVSEKTHGIDFFVMDIDDPSSIQEIAAAATEKYPALNVVINNAGIMKKEDLKRPQLTIADSEATVITNLLGPIRLTTALLPHLLQQPDATVMNVTSGVGFVPMPSVPTYSATKAAIHSYTMSLRAQLATTSVRVLELVPTGVQTHLIPGLAADTRMMSMDDYIREVMTIFRENPEADEICVERVKGLRFAEARGTFKQEFKRLQGVAL